jgi:hypothetical protein
MTADEITQLIKSNDFWNGAPITPNQVEILANLAPNEYQKVILTLLKEPLADKTGLQGLDYRNTYAHRIYGCILFILRPSVNLYPDVLTGALDIDDPSFIRYGASALLQVKSREQVGLDLFTAIEKYKDNDDTLAHIFYLLYWVGFTAKNLLQGRTPIEIHENFVPLLIDKSPHESDPSKVEEVAYKLVESMLEILVQQSTGQAARSCIGLLTCCDVEAFPPSLRARIIQAYVRAASSPDEYMRNRVSAPSIVELIRSLR